MRPSACLRILPILLVSSALAQWPGATSPPANLRAGYDAITIPDAMQHLSYLAGPECEGRGTGQPGFQKAAEYVAERFREYGLKPVGENGTYFQYGTMWRAKPQDGAALKLGSETVPVGPDLFLGRLFNDLNLTNAPIYVVRVADPKSTIPEGVSLRGAIVILSGEGTGSPFRVDLRRQEPAIILNVKEKAQATVWTVTRTKPSGTNERLQGTITQAAATRLVRAAGDDRPAFGTNEVSGIDVRRLPGSATLQAPVTTEEVRVPNVVGVYEGSDPSLKNQYVAIGAHLDHLGTNGEQTWWGADDDGSGSTAMITVAKAFSAGAARPKRSILFLAFFGEEMGLLGSKFYVDNPIAPIENHVALLQMDMVGRDSYGAQNGDPNRMDKLWENYNTMRLVGSKRISMDLHDVILEQNKHVGFRFLYDSEDVYTRSDHYMFAAKGVPVAFQFCGFTPDYHQPSDTVDKINFLKLTNAAKLFYLTANAVANRTEPLRRNGSG